MKRKSTKFEEQNKRGASARSSELHYCMVGVASSSIGVEYIHGDRFASLASCAHRIASPGLQKHHI
jgi:hypothetical protein